MSLPAPDACDGASSAAPSSGGFACGRAPLPAPRWTASSSGAAAGFHSLWKGHGVSRHAETEDITLWKNMRWHVQLEWNGDLSITGTGVSVLRRDCMGASQALASMVTEEEERLARERLLEKERFPGQPFTLRSLLASTRLTGEAEPTLDPEPAIIEPMPAELLQGVVTAPPQPGVHPDEIAVPFIVFGRGNVKSGHMILHKVHIKWVYNHIVYAGLISASQVEEGSGEEQEVPLELLMEHMEAASLDQPFEQPVQAIRLELQARWSRASLAMIARVDSARRPTPAAAAASPVSHSAPADAAASSNSDRPISPNMQIAHPVPMEANPAATKTDTPAVASPPPSPSDKHALSRQQQRPESQLQSPPAGNPVH